MLIANFCKLRYKRFYNIGPIWTPMYETPILSCLASGGGTEVEHLPRHPKVKGLSPAIAAGTGREKWHKNFVEMPQMYNI